jgi:hypothetical protein
MFSAGAGLIGFLSLGFSKTKHYIALENTTQKFLDGHHLMCKAKNPTCDAKSGIYPKRLKLALGIPGEKMLDFHRVLR